VRKGQARGLEGGLSANKSGLADRSGEDCGWGVWKVEKRTAPTVVVAEGVEAGGGLAGGEGEGSMVRVEKRMSEEEG